MDKEKKIFADITMKMQQYFCVRKEGFKLQDFLQTLKTFCDQIKQLRKVSFRSQKNSYLQLFRDCVAYQESLRWPFCTEFNSD